MQGTVILRSLGVLALAASIAGCHASSRSAAGQTPLPSNTTMAQANSTLPPDQAMTTHPGDKYFVVTDKALHGVSFSIWTNGKPATVVETGGKTLDITKDLSAHTNVVVVKWNRRTKNGTGTLTLRTRTKVVGTARVTAKSPSSGSKSFRFKAPPAPMGR